MTRSRSRSGRGFTLVEVMVALGVLAVGLLGLMRMHVIGISSNAGARMNTQASELAQELAQALERLDPNHPLLSPTNGTGPAPTKGFGRLVDPYGNVDTSTARQWSDGLIPGVRSDSEIPTGYTRRWSIWGYSPTVGGTCGSVIVAVSVVWSEPVIGRPREVVVYTQVAHPATLMKSILANE